MEVYAVQLKQTLKKFTALNVYIGKKSQINDLSFYLKKHKTKTSKLKQAEKKKQEQIPESNKSLRKKIFLRKL